MMKIKSSNQLGDILAAETATAHEPVAPNRVAQFLQLVRDAKIGAYLRGNGINVALDGRSSVDILKELSAKVAKARKRLSKQSKLKRGGRPSRFPPATRLEFILMIQKHGANGLSRAAAIDCIVKVRYAINWSEKGEALKKKSRKLRRSIENCLDNENKSMHGKGIAEIFTIYMPWEKTI